jgi:threonine aldolase
MLKHAGHANACAHKLSEALTSIPGVTLVNPTEANAVFVQMPENAVATLHKKGWVFYTFIGSGHCRFMCSWATTDEDIESLTHDIREVMA